MRLAQLLCRPDLVLAWGEPFDSPLWEDRRDGLAYLCRDFVCEAPRVTAGGLYEQLTGHELPADGTIRRGG